MTWRPAAARAALLLSACLLVAPVRADDAPKKARDTADARGAAVFSRYCVLCHGARGEGDGIAAKHHNPRPANLRRSTLADAQKEAIIRGGGRAVGRSDAMPPWGHELNDRQVGDLLVYLAKIRSARN